MKCKVCGGKGTVQLYQKDRTCNTCQGQGKLTDKVMIDFIANCLDYPSVYMSAGPSPHALRQAKKIADALKGSFDLSDMEKKNEVEKADSV